MDTKLEDANIEIKWGVHVLVFEVFEENYTGCKY